MVGLEKRCLKVKASILVFCLLIATNVCGENVVAVLNMYFVKDTEERAAEICFEQSERNCMTWATFYLYEAEVKKILHGELPSRKIKVIYGRHALLKKDFKGEVVVLRKLPDHDEADYQVVERGVRGEEFCFSSITKEVAAADDLPDKLELKCYQ